MTTPTIHERVAQRAYEIFEESGRQHGHCTDNWLRAEKEICEQEQPVPETSLPAEPHNRPLEPHISAEPQTSLPAEPEVSAPQRRSSRR